MATDVNPTSIAERVVEAILAQKLAPGERLGEQALAENFAVSRTMVREALMQLQARGFVEVQSRRGWYVVEPSAEEARDAFSARRIVEAGILAESEGRPLQKAIRKLRDHIADEQRAIEGADAATRAFLLADFHVCLAEQMGHQLLVDVLRDLTARTTLAATLYQSRHEAGQSWRRWRPATRPGRAS
jgi:DNA-binding GntR family transcriptional regulator